VALTLDGIRRRVLETVYSSEPRLRPYSCAITNAAGGGTTINVPDGDAWQVGDIGEFVGNTERFLVTAIATNSMTVIRDYDNNGATTLASSGDIINKNPRFSEMQIYQEEFAALRELRANGVWRLASETIAFTGDDWYNVTDTAMEDVFSAWYIENGNFKTPYFYFNTDPANTQPKIFLGAMGFSGNIYINYKTTYDAHTELPDRLEGLMVNYIVYKLLGIAGAGSTYNPGKRTDRTLQGGQEHRDSYWFFREYQRLARQEEAYLKEQVKKLPGLRVALRSRRFVR